MPKIRRKKKYINRGHKYPALATKNLSQQKRDYSIKTIKILKFQKLRPKSLTRSSSRVMIILSFVEIRISEITQFRWIFFFLVLNFMIYPRHLGKTISFLGDITEKL